MGALRKAGVWLGLVEDDDDRGYDDRGYRVRRRLRRRDESTTSGDALRRRVRDDEDDDVDGPPALPRRVDLERAGSSERLGRPTRPSCDRRRDRARASERRRRVRSITRPDRRARRPVELPDPRQPRAGTRRCSRAQPRRRSVEDDERRYQITTLHPTTYNEARTIGEHFRDGVPVIMNLTEMDEADAKRLVDFAAGLAFGLRGTIERVTNRVFLLSPANVQVTAEDKAKIAEGGFFNQS